MCFALLGLVVVLAVLGVLLDERVALAFSVATAAQFGIEAAQAVAHRSSSPALAERGADVVLDVVRVTRARAVVDLVVAHPLVDRVAEWDGG